MNYKVDISRFLQKLDSCFNQNDLESAEKCISFWENEAINAKDDRALLTILNESLGVYRRVNNEEKAIIAIEKSKKLISILNLEDNISGVTIYVNMATDYTHFGKVDAALMLYEKAKSIYKKNGKIKTYEYASLLNNCAGALSSIRKYNESEKYYLEAIDVLKQVGNRDAEIALSLTMLSHVIFDKNDKPDDETYEKVESLLDEAIKFLNSDKIIRDGNFAFILTKCAPSFKYFKRPLIANEMMKLANEIYNKKPR